MERAEGCEVVSPIDQSRGGKESEASADESLLFYCESPLYPHKTQISILIFTHLPTGKSKEAEVKRINKELANIRSKFKGDKTLDGYQKKKYVCKLLFIFLLGHDIDFGHMEAVNLLSSNKYSEKQIVSTPKNCFNNHLFI